MVCKLTKFEVIEEETACLTNPTHLSLENEIQRRRGSIFQPKCACGWPCFFEVVSGCVLMWRKVLENWLISHRNGILILPARRSQVQWTQSMKIPCRMRCASSCCSNLLPEIFCKRLSQKSRQLSDLGATLRKRVRLASCFDWSSIHISNASMCRCSQLSKKIRQLSRSGQCAPREWQRPCRHVQRTCCLPIAPFLPCKNALRST